MKPHPRIRKTIKWGGAVVTVLLVVVWIGSGWFGASWMTKRGAIFEVMGGTAQIGSDAGTWFIEYDPGFMVSSHNHPFGWWFKWSDNGRQSGYGRAWLLTFPLWVAVLSAFLPCAIAWRLDAIACRRARTNLCPKCHYDRAGIAGDAKCPECGAGGSAAP